MKVQKLLTTMLLLLALSGFSYAADRTLTGNVTISPSGDILPGTQILLKGTFTGTVTNNDGEYSLDIPVDQVTLIITFIGFKTQEIRRCVKYFRCCSYRLSYFREKTQPCAFSRNDLGGRVSSCAGANSWRCACR